MPVDEMFAMIDDPALIDAETATLTQSVEKDLAEIRKLQGIVDRARTRLAKLDRLRRLVAASAFTTCGPPDGPGRVTAEQLKANGEPRGPVPVPEKAPPSVVKRQQEDAAQAARTRKPAAPVATEPESPPPINAEWATATAPIAESLKKVRAAAEAAPFLQPKADLAGLQRPGMPPPAPMGPLFAGLQGEVQAEESDEDEDEPEEMPLEPVMEASEAVSTYIRQMVTCWLPDPLPAIRRASTPLAKEHMGKALAELRAYPEWWGRAADLTGDLERNQVELRLSGVIEAPYDVRCREAITAFRSAGSAPGRGLWSEFTLPATHGRVTCLYRPDCFGSDAYRFRITGAPDRDAPPALIALHPAAEGEALPEYAARLFQAMQTADAPPARKRRKKAEQEETP